MTGGAIGRRSSHACRRNEKGSHVSFSLGLHSAFSLRTPTKLAGLYEYSSCRLRRLDLPRYPQTLHAAGSIHRIPKQLKPCSFSSQNSGSHLNEEKKKNLLRIDLNLLPERFFMLCLPGPECRPTRSSSCCVSGPSCSTSLSSIRWCIFSIISLAKRAIMRACCFCAFGTPQTAT
jgi:hypothetical protein